MGPAAARRGRGGEAGRPRSPAWVQAASPGLVTKGTWEDRSSFDFPKASDRCPHPELPKKTKQPTLTRDLGGVGEEMFGFRIPELGWDEGSGQGQAGLARPPGAWSKAGVKYLRAPPTKEMGKRPGVSVVLKFGCKIESSEGF